MKKTIKLIYCILLVIRGTESFKTKNIISKIKIIIYMLLRKVATLAIIFRFCRLV